MQSFQHSYTRPGVPGPVHILSTSLGPGLHTISAPNTSQVSLTTISNLTSLVRILIESMVSLHHQMDNMLRIVHPK